MARLLYRLGSFGARRRRTVLLVWPLLLAAVAVLGLSSFGGFSSSSSIPGSSASAALTEMDRHWPSADAPTGELVLQAPEGTTLTDPAVQATVTAGLADTAGIAGVLEVGDPYGERGEVSEDGRTAIAEIVFDAPADTLPAEQTLTAVRDSAAAIEADGVTALVSGEPFEYEAAPVSPAEGVGLLITLAVLVITFGSLLAAGLPLLIALVGVAASMLAMFGATALFDVSNSAPILAGMLGLAVGIDYALFVISRHRAQLAGGMDVRTSIATAVATAGSAVVFAGATVVIALAGLMVAGVPMLTSMGLAAAGAVAFAVLTTLTLLPAVLAVAGERLVPERTSRTARATAAGRTPFGVRWVAAVARRPVLTIVGVVTGLLVMAIPALQLSTSLTDASSAPTTDSTRQAYDLVADSFGPGANGPLLLLVTGTDGLEAVGQSTAAEVAALPGVADVSPVQLAEDGEAALLQVVPTTGPRDPQTTELVETLNATVDPLAAETGADIAVTGQTAISIDVSTSLAGSLLPFAAVVVGLSLLLLLVAFRSIAVPVKATVGFLLSLVAAFGATVAVFQWGWGADLLGIPQTGPIASFAPIMVMAVLFGLAMDYEVFLVSSMREEYSRTRDARAAVLDGSRHAARVVTAAALIMISVFGSFMFSHDPNIMPIAFALGVGVLVDAFLVRMTLVPAVLTLLGDRAWWLPAWLERRLPHVDVEGGDLTAHDRDDDRDDDPADTPPATVGTAGAMA